MGEMHEIASEMEDVSDTAECKGLDMDEYGEYGFPDEKRRAVLLAMNHWETGCFHLAEAARLMRSVAVDVEGEDRRC